MMRRPFAIARRGRVSAPGPLRAATQAALLLGSAAALQLLAAPALAQNMDAPAPAAAADNRAVAVPAQGPGGLRITPSLDFGFTAVKNTLADAPGYGLQQSGDIVTQVRPGLLVTGRLGRTNARLAYGLDLRQHSRPLPGQAETDRYRNSLNAALSSELLERVLFIDASATITQQTLLAYGQQTADTLTYNPNRSEVGQFSVRPYSRGSVAGYAIYELALNADATRVKGSLVPGSHGAGATLTLSSPTSGALLGWNALLSQQNSRFSGGQTTDNTRLSLGLKFSPDIDLQGGLRVGQEAVKISGIYDASYANYGGELRWTPSPRTTALVSADKRYFGTSYQVLLEHREQRSSFRLTGTRDASNNANAYGVGTPVTLYQLFFNQFASVQPDPVLREQLVRDFLASIGQDPGAVVSGGFLNPTSTLQQRQDLGMTYAGLRTTFMLQAYNSRVGSLVSAGDQNLSNSVRQFGLSGSVNYRLTPQRGLTLGTSWLRTQGNGIQVGNRLRSVNLNLSDQIGRYLTAAVTARYSLFDGPINPYHETSLGASLSLRF